MKKTGMVMVLFTLLACTVSTVLAEEVVLLKEIDRPDTLFVDKDNIYISQGTEVYIYSNTDFKLKKTFGKKGEGPGEFKIDPGYHRGGIYLNVQGESIYVTSIGEVSLITKDGIIKKEVKSISGEEFMPFNDKFVGWELIPALQQNKKAYKAICLYDSKMKKIKEIASIPHSVQRGKGFMIYSGEYIFKTYRGKLFIFKGKKYQLIENVEKEEWEMHITPVKKMNIVL